MNFILLLTTLGSGFFMVFSGQTMNRKIFKISLATFTVSIIYGVLTNLGYFAT